MDIGKNWRLLAKNSMIPRKKLNATSWDEVGVSVGESLCTILLIFPHFPTGSSPQLVRGSLLQDSPGQTGPQDDCERAHGRGCEASGDARLVTSHLGWQGRVLHHLGRLGPGPHHQEADSTRHMVTRLSHLPSNHRVSGTVDLHTFDLLKYVLFPISTYRWPVQIHLHI